MASMGVRGVQVQLPDALGALHGAQVQQGHLLRFLLRLLRRPGRGRAPRRSSSSSRMARARRITGSGTPASLATSMP